MPIVYIPTSPYLAATSEELLSAVRRDFQDLARILEEGDIPTPQFITVKITGINQTVGHQLGSVPRFVGVEMNFQGTVGIQSKTRTELVLETIVTVGNPNVSNQVTLMLIP